MMWNPVNENLLASASVDKHFYIWDIEREKVKVHVSLPAFAVMLQWSQMDPNCILLLLFSGTFLYLDILKKGDVKLLNLNEQKVDKVGNYAKIAPTILRWHPKNV